MGRKFLLLGIIIALAGFLRIYDLAKLPNGLHWDEQDTGYQAYSLLKTGKDYFGNPIPLFAHSMADYRTPVFIYTAVPFIAKLGLTPFSVRLPSVIWGLLSIILIYCLAKTLFPDKKWFGHIAALVLALSPWHVLYGRQSVECNSMLPLLMLGVLAFYKGLKNSSWYWVSALGFALSIAAYSPAKMFVPLLILLLAFLYRKSLSIKPLLLPAVIFVAISGPILYQSTFGPAGTRFHDVSITTDPTISTYVDRQRLEHALSSGNPLLVGMQATLLDKFIVNKPKVIWDNFISNYTRTFSLEYLFLKGDQNLRQSPSPDSIGQFHLLEIIPFIIVFI
jgi:predicted membrane-bound mannosyltransferase